MTDRTITLSNASYFNMGAISLNRENQSVTVTEEDLTSEELQLIERAYLSGYITTEIDRAVPYNYIFAGPTYILRSHQWVPQDNNLLLNGPGNFNMEITTP